MLLAHGVDCQQFQHLLGTIFQHQLFTEIVDCYEKVARITSEYGCKNSSFIPHIIEFTKISFQAVEETVFPIALQLNDLANLLAETSLSVCKGIAGSAYGFVDMYVLHPVETAQQFATLLGGVMKFVGDAMVLADSEGIGWSYYVESLEKEHSYDARYAQEVIDQFKDWCEHSSAQEKIQATSKVITDCILHPKLLSMVGGACCSLISEIPEIKFLKGFSDISAEYQLATEFGDVGLHSIQDATTSLMEAEIKVTAKSAQKNVKIGKIDFLNKDGQTKHAFGDRAGHFIDTAINRNLVREIVNDSKNFLIEDMHGVSWYARIEEDGSQLWAEVYNKTVRNCGKNKTPLSCDLQTGLKKSRRPIKK